MAKFYLTLFVLFNFLFASSCIRSRKWSTPQYKHLYYEVAVSPKNDYKIYETHSIKDGMLNIKVGQIKICHKIQYDVEQTYLIENVKYPRSNYYMLLGGLLAGFSLPSYYLGIYKSEGTNRIINFSVGTILFLIPGVTMAGYGFLKKSKEYTKKDNLGINKREIKNDSFECGKRNFAKNLKVEILNKFGFFYAGVLKNGEISIKLDGLHPLYNSEKDLCYVELYLDSKKIKVIKLNKSRCKNNNK